MSPNNYKSKGRRPGPSDGRGQRNKAPSGHSPPDSRGQVRMRRDRSAQLTASSPYEPEHRYESLKRGKDKVDQVSEYGHYIEIVS